LLSAKKKRTAEVQLNKDDVEAGRDELEGDESGQWQGNAQASEEELKSRK
jgi:hypothetical protein